MALMSPQAISRTAAITYTLPTTGDTIDARVGGQILSVRVGATATTITVTPGGTQDYSGVSKSGLSSGSVTNEDRDFYIPPSIGDPTTGLCVVTYSQTTGVTAALRKI